MSVHLVILTGWILQWMDLTETPKKDNRKLKYIFFNFLSVCLSIRMVTLISESTEPIYLKVHQLLCSQLNNESLFHQNRVIKKKVIDIYVFELTQGISLPANVI